VQLNNGQVRVERLAEHPARTDSNKAISIATARRVTKKLCQVELKANKSCVSLFFDGQTYKWCTRWHHSVVKCST
jgi:hypothetical protein